jgi:hypothetical protein
VAHAQLAVGVAAHGRRGAALLANINAAYAIYHGPEGLVNIAKRVHHMTAAFAYGVKKLRHRCVSCVPRAGPGLAGPTVLRPTGPPCSAF